MQPSVRVLERSARRGALLHKRMKGNGLSCYAVKQWLWLVLLAFQVLNLRGASTSFRCIVPSELKYEPVMTR